MPAAVWEMSTVCSLSLSVPLSVRKLSRFGICSRSEATLSRSRNRCVLSKTMLTTCWMPLPSEQFCDCSGAAGAWADAGPGSIAATNAAMAASRISRLMPNPLVR